MDGKRRCATERTRQQMSRWHGAHLSPRIHQEHNSDTEVHTECQLRRAGGPDQWKRSVGQPTQNSVVEGTRGKNRSVSRTGPALSRWGNCSRGPIPTAGWLSESGEKHLRLSLKQLTCGRLNEWELDSPCRSHTPWTGHRSAGRRSGWELAFRDCGAIPGRGRLLTVERRIQGVWGRRSWWEMPLEESQASVEARRYCWVTYRGWSITMASLPRQTPASAAEQ